MTWIDSKTEEKPERTPIDYHVVQDVFSRKYFLCRGKWGGKYKRVASVGNNSVLGLSMVALLNKVNESKKRPITKWWKT
tara:strand:- start:1458 stop:1694 length:237 start_codon:yes stop_codon:yes gene_type:complete